jgi:hypothetical protein
VGAKVLGLVLNDAHHSDGHWRVRYSTGAKYYNKEEGANA